LFLSPKKSSSGPCSESSAARAKFSFFLSLDLSCEPVGSCACFVASVLLCFGLRPLGDSPRARALVQQSLDFPIAARSFCYRVKGLRPHAGLRLSFDFSAKSLCSTGWFFGYSVPWMHVFCAEIFSLCVSFSYAVSDFSFVACTHAPGEITGNRS
jgi:hypothetical protein